MPNDTESKSCAAASPARDVKPERISEIVADVAYWRKANAVHRWSVGLGRLAASRQYLLSPWCPRPDSNGHVLANTRF